MEKNRTTIKDVARLADVSIATVSHVINHTRYVSPEVAGRVEQVIRETGYIEKLSAKEKKLQTEGFYTIAAMFPNVTSGIYREMITSLKKLITARGYQFVVLLAQNDLKEELQQLENLMRDKRVAGILHVPVSDVAANYRKFIASGIPFVCMERNILGMNIDSVEFRDREALFKGTDYLLECGHKNLMFLRETVNTTTSEEWTRGYLEALASHQINENNANIIDIDLSCGEEESLRAVRRILRRNAPTAVIAGGNRLTFCLVKALRSLGIRYPDEISIIGFGDEDWMDLLDPPLTALRHDTEGLSALAVKLLFEKINTGSVVTKNRYADIELNIRESAKMLYDGPYGEATSIQDDIVLTEEEKRQLRGGGFRVAISFHYTGTAWAELHERGMRDELERCGISVISVTDAHFDPELQNRQIEGIAIQRPDAVIAVPADDRETAEQFRELSKVSKLVFISSVPENLGKNSYVSCVSVNERENGANTGRMMGEYFRGSGHVKAGLIKHGAIFYGTRVRDSAAEKVLADDYPNIEIVSSRNFGEIENAYQVCLDMLQSHPEIQALYVSWDQPALRVIRALRELGREDVAVFTTDLDHEIALHMASGIVRGMSTQRPYEQGRVAALAAAKSLAGGFVPKFLGVQPYLVEPGQLQRAWKEIFHEPAPEDLP